MIIKYTDTEQHFLLQIFYIFTTWYKTAAALAQAAAYSTMRKILTPIRNMWKQWVTDNLYINSEYPNTYKNKYLLMIITINKMMIKRTVSLIIRMITILPIILQKHKMGSHGLDDYKIYKTESLKYKTQSHTLIQ